MTELKEDNLIVQIIETWHKATPEKQQEVLDYLRKNVPYKAIRE